MRLGRWRAARRAPAAVALVAVTIAAAGCADAVDPSPAPLFAVPLTIAGTLVGPAIIDTGGAYEVMLSDSFGLRVVDTTQVVAFGGAETVSVTEGFRYDAGGWPAIADGAIVGLSVYECNGLGFFFLRNTGAVLSLDFDKLEVILAETLPAGGARIPFQPPPRNLPEFDAAFVEVDVTAGAATWRVLGLLDTGANTSVIRRSLVAPAAAVVPDRIEVAIAHRKLGAISLPVGLFDNDSLPDLILGTDAMRGWGTRWHFSFAPVGGRVVVFGEEQTPPDGASASSF